MTNRCCLEKHQNSLLVRGDILYHSKLVPEVLKLDFGQRLGENICCLLTCCGYVLVLHYSLLHHVSDVVVFDVDVL